MIDTHTHLYFRDAFPDGGMEVVERALLSGVEKMVMPNVDIASASQLLRLYHAAPADSVYVAVGFHPENVDPDWRAKTDEVFSMFEGENPVAVGEVGIDLYHDSTWRMQQMDCLGYQIDRARSMSLPVIIHCREALDEVLHIVGGFRAEERPRLLFHSFTAGPAEAERILEVVPDAVFGINGVVTFKNAPGLREAVRMLGVERIVLETDSPYLAPVPKRGRTNESSFLCYIRDKIAETAGSTPPETDACTAAVARAFFRL